MTTTERTTARIENFIRLLGETIRGELQQPKETTGGDYKRKPTATGQKKLLHWSSVRHSKEEDTNLFQGRGPKELQDKCRSLKKKLCKT